MEPRHRSVSEIMQTEVATLAPDERLDLADDIMELGRVRHMPVVEDGRLVGMVSNRDLLQASLSKALNFDARSRRTFLRSVDVSEVMGREVVSIGADATLSEAAELLVKRRIGALPVVDGQGRLIGLVTETDLLAAALLGEPQGASAESSFADWLRRELEGVRRMRDELRVRAHLGRAELREQWEALEKQFEGLERRAARISQLAEEPLGELRRDARKVVDDLREGFRRIRAAL